MVIFVFYKNINLIKQPDSIEVLVNKNNKLPKDYIPNDLELINYNYSINSQSLRKIAKENFEDMCQKAKENGYTIKAVSTYRSFEYQSKFLLKFFLIIILLFQVILCLIQD